MDSEAGRFAVEYTDLVVALGAVTRMPAVPGLREHALDLEDLTGATCQHALRQARRLARNLRGTPKPYRYRTRGQMATLGTRHGIAVVGGLRVRGVLGWMFARAYHCGVEGVRFFPFVMPAGTRGKLCTQSVRFFPLVARGMSRGHVCSPRGPTQPALRRSNHGKPASPPGGPVRLACPPWP